MHSQLICVSALDHPVFLALLTICISAVGDPIVRFHDLGQSGNMTSDPVCLFLILERHVKE